MIAPNATLRHLTSLHEAAHAVMAHVGKGSITTLTSVPASGAHGRILSRFPKADAVGSVAMNYAGGICEWIANGRVGKMLGPGTGGDREHAEKTIFATHGADYGPAHSQMVADACQPAHDTVVRYWPVIERIALYLDNHDSMSGLLCHGLCRKFETQLERK